MAKIKYLVIAEKEVLGKAIADAIPGKQSVRGTAIYKGDYVITWASGHLLALKAPEDYEATLAKWELASLPIYFPNWGMKVKPASERGGDPARRVALIGELLKNAECVIHAGDPDEEGQLLIDELLRWHHYAGPVYRLATADTTAPALRSALQHMDDNKAHEQDGWSAYARAVADFMVGINLSRFYSLKNNATLTIGRVQSPTLGMVVQRDLLIEGHHKTVYYDIYADCLIDGRVVRCKYTPPKDDPGLTEGMILDKAYAEGEAKKLSGFRGEGEVKSGTEKEAGPLPFNLGKLQSYCGKKFGYSLEKTMSITQSLRDNYNAISYNRTDVQYLPENCFKEAPSTMEQVVKNIHYRHPRMDMSIHSRCFNDSKIEAHFAIIPQNTAVNLNDLTQEERNVYLAICKYYMTQFMPPAIKTKRKLTILLPNGGTLTAFGTVIDDPGYLALFAKDEDRDGGEAGPLNEIGAGLYPVSVSSTTAEERTTKPPSYYTQHTLNEDMSRIAKYVSDPNIKALLLEKDKDKSQENGSIGTVATRAGIVSGLIKRGFLEEKTAGKTTRLVSTPLGRELYRILPDDLRQPNLTALWWVIQDNIRHGTASHEDLERDVLQMINRTMQMQSTTIASDVSTKAANGALGVCPWCGGSVREGKRGFGCMNWKQGCKFVIWKEARGGLLRDTRWTASDVKKLLAGKKVKKAKLLKNNGDYFTANVSLASEKSEYGAKFELSFEGPGSKNHKRKSKK